MLVDKDFHEKYKDIRFWLMKSLSGKFYPMMYLNKKKVFVHRAVMGFPSGLEVDHVNLNTLDNRASNLRICSHSANMKNRPMHKNNKCGYKGVYFRKDKNKYVSQITVDGVKRHLGYFKTALEGHERYLQAAKQYFLL